MLVGKGEGPVARVAVAVLHLLEQEREGALHMYIVGLPSDGDA